MKPQSTIGSCPLSYASKVEDDSKAVSEVAHMAPTNLGSKSMANCVSQQAKLSMGALPSLTWKCSDTINGGLVCNDKSTGDLLSQEDTKNAKGALGKCSANHHIRSNHQP